MSTNRRCPRPPFCILRPFPENDFDPPFIAATALVPRSTIIPSSFYTMAAYDPDQARQELPWAVRQYAPLIADPAREALRGRTEIATPRSFRIVAVSDSHVWAHCIFKEHLTASLPYKLGYLYTYSFDANSWETTALESLEPIANAAIHRPTNTLFFVSTDHMINSVRPFEIPRKNLTFNIPNQAITLGMNIHGIRILPLSGDSCIVSDTVNSAWLATFGAVGSVKRLHIPHESCIAVAETHGGKKQHLMITYETSPGYWNTGIVPFPVTPTAVPEVVSPMWIPTPDVFPPLIDGTQIFRFVNSFYFDSPSIGQCLALISPTTVLIHKAFPPHDTHLSFVTTCAIADPIDILYRADTDSLYVITHVGEIVRIPCYEFTHDKAAEAPLQAKAICKVPAASVRFAMNYLPGSVFAYHNPSGSWIVFPQNTRLINRFSDPSVYPVE